MAPDHRPHTSSIGGVGWFNDLSPTLFAIPFGSHFCEDHLSILVEDIVCICIFIPNEECRTVGTALVGNKTPMVRATPSASWLMMSWMHVVSAESGGKLAKMERITKTRKYLFIIFIEFGINFSIDQNVLYNRIRTPGFVTC